MGRGWLLVAAFISVVQFLTPFAMGGLQIHDWEQRDDFLSFSITGTIDGPLPIENRQFLFITSDDDTDDFSPNAVGLTLFPDPFTITASSAGVARSFFITGINNTDRFSIRFHQELRVGERISGSFRSDIPSGLFDSSGFDFPRIFWGRTAGQPDVLASSGTFQGSAERGDTLLPISSIDISPMGRKIRIPLVFGREIGISFSPDLTPGSWVELGNFHKTGEVGEFTDQDSARLQGGRGFYRAFLRPAPPP